jgi:hypothetical protein
MPRTYTYETRKADGTVTVETHEMSPDMERVADQIAAFNDANPNFWCRCDNPETGHIEPRGHSVDVYCKTCGGFLQVG